MEFVKAERARGHDVQVICPRADSAAPCREFAGATVTEVPIAMIRRFSLRQSLAFVKAVHRVLAGQTFDVVLVYDFRGCSLLPLMARRHARVWIANIRNSNLRRPDFPTRVADYLTRLEMHAFAAVSITDEPVGKRLLGNLPFTVIPNGAAVGAFAQGRRQPLRRELGFTDDDRVIIYMGAIAKQRRPQRIVESFGHAAAAHPAVKLLLLGDSDLLPALKEQAAHAGLAERAHFPGRVPYAQMPDYLAAGDIGFAYYPDLPQFDGNIPLKTAEMLAAGLPTVGTDTAGNRFFITHGENGLLAPDDPPALGRALAQVAADADLAQRLHAHARPSVDCYDWDAIVAERLLPLYRRTLEGRRA